LNGIAQKIFGRGLRPRSDVVKPHWLVAVNEIGLGDASHK
jgi:hypothetical protein